MRSEGLDAVKSRLVSRLTGGSDKRAREEERLLGVNVGKNKTSTALADDFVKGIEVCNLKTIVLHIFNPINGYSVLETLHPNETTPYVDWPCLALSYCCTCLLRLMASCTSFRLPHAMQQLGSHADFIVVNISSPNTPGLRALQSKDVCVRE
jgi:hypothetical protein